MTESFFDPASLSMLCAGEPKGLVLNDLLQDLERITASPPMRTDSPLLCGNCEEDAWASSRCKDCDELLCGKCMRAHVRVKLTKDHTIIHIRDLHDSPSPSSSNSSGNNVESVKSNNSNKICDFHTSGKEQLYCDNCGFVFCAECDSSEHEGHIRLLLQEAVDYALDSNMKFLTEAKVQALAVKESLEISQRIQESINTKSETVAREIKNMMHRFRMAIEERESELLEKLKYILSTKSKAIQNQINTFKILFCSFSEASRELADALECGTPIDIIQVRDCVSAKLKKLRLMRKSMIQANDTIQVVPPNWSILLAISSMGDVTGHSQRALEHSSISLEGLNRNINHTPSLFQRSNYLEDVVEKKDGMSPVPVVNQELHVIRRAKGNPVVRPLKIRNIVNHVQRDYSKAGVPQLVFGEEGEQDGQFCRPWGVCCNSEGKIIVADRSNNRIQVFAPNGAFLFKFGSQGDSPGHFDRPAGVATDSHDSIIVADKDNHRIQIFTKDGDFILTFGEKGSKLGQFNYPWDVAADSRGLIAVCDSRNHRIQLFDGKGTFLAKYGFDPTQSSIKSIDSPRGVCFDSNSNVIATDFNNHRLVVIDPNFRNGRFFGTEGSEEKQFLRPQGIAIDSTGNIVVADSRNNRIQIFQLRGNSFHEFGSIGKEPGQMDRPSGLCISPTGEIVVVDFGNNRIQVF